MISTPSRSRPRVSILVLISFISPRRMGFAIPSSTIICAARRIASSSPSGKTIRFGDFWALCTKKRMTSRVLPSRASRESLYASKSVIGTRATPVSIAAFAIAGASQSRTRGSNGFGIIYWRPNSILLPPYARITESGTSSFASFARACDAASFISSLIALARTSSVPRKMNGNPRTLFT